MLELEEGDQGPTRLEIAKKFSCSWTNIVESEQPSFCLCFARFGILASTCGGEKKLLAFWKKTLCGTLLQSGYSSVRKVHQIGAGELTVEVTFEDPLVPLERRPKSSIS